jgi:hypothetical protein
LKTKSIPEGFYQDGGIIRLYPDVAQSFQLYQLPPQKHRAHQRLLRYTYSFPENDELIGLNASVPDAPLQPNPDKPEAEDISRKGAEFAEKGTAYF